MNITYRTKRRLQRAALIGATVLLLLILVGFCWVIWLERYIVYDREGATLNFDLVDTPSAGQLAMPPSVGETVPIYVNEGLDAIDLNRELSQLTGYYIDSETLQNDIAGIQLFGHIHDGDAGLLQTIQNRPVDGSRAAIGGQQRGMDIDGAVLGVVQ